MGTLLKGFNSTVGRKLIMGISGLGLVLFVIVHLFENLLLYKGADAYNGYVETLHSFGILLVFAEIGLALLILLHALLAIRITKTNHDARGHQRYAVSRSKGDPSRSNIASRNMIWTGSVLLFFLVVHIRQFRFGPDMSDGYITHLGSPGSPGGQAVRDLYRLVVETFHNPWYVGLYVFTMLLLGLHLRHGFWSAFQSLGAMAPRLSRPMYMLGLFLGVVLAIGFLMIPLWFYFGAQA